MQNANGSEYCDGLRLKTGLAEMLRGGVIRWWTKGRFDRAYGFASRPTTLADVRLP
jgi:hypothetical protein